MELRARDKQKQLEQLAHEAKRGKITLVFAAKDEEKNNAAVIKEVLDAKV
jgi:uncharacterized protein YeaO (DUF488 family)